jgi:toxoflavin synthase
MPAAGPTRWQPVEKVRGGVNAPPLACPTVLILLPSQRTARHASRGAYISENCRLAHPARDDYSGGFTRPRRSCRFARSPRQSRYRFTPTEETAMTTDYNQIAEQYRKAKQQPWRLAVEEYSFLKLIGDLTGKKVIDLACGEGFFTRKLKQRGAATVVGIDISREMVALAQAQEAQSPLGISYVVEDARATGPRQDFDLAVAAWLLVYAHDREELGAMCRGLARRLKPGGRLATLTTNPGLYLFHERPDYGKYGFDVRLEDHIYEGATIVWTIYFDDSSFEIENYYLPIEAHEVALREAGFRDVAFHQLSLAPDAAPTGDSGYWDEMLDHPPAIMIDAIKT